jgi:hypothetical protein
MPEKMAEICCEIESRENILIPTYIRIELKKTLVNATKWNAHFTYLKQEFIRVSDRKITGIYRLQPSRKNLGNGRNFDEVIK